MGKKQNPFAQTRTVKCSICHKTGHNMRTCNKTKNSPAVKPAQKTPTKPRSPRNPANPGMKTAVGKNVVASQVEEGTVISDEATVLHSEILNKSQVLGKSSATASVLSHTTMRNGAQAYRSVISLSDLDGPNIVVRNSSVAGVSLKGSVTIEDSTVTTMSDISGEVTIGHSKILDASVVAGQAVVHHSSLHRYAKVFNKGHVSRSHMWGGDVCGDAKVDGSTLRHTHVSGEAEVDGCTLLDSTVSGEAKLVNVTGDSVDVSGRAVVSNVNLPDHAVIGGDGYVTRPEDVIVLPDGSGGYVTVHRAKGHPQPWIAGIQGDLTHVNEKFLNAAIDKVTRPLV